MRIPLQDPSAPLPRPKVVRLLVRLIAGAIDLPLQAPGLHFLLSATGVVENRHVRLALAKDSLLLLPEYESACLHAVGEGLLLSIDLPDDEPLKALNAPFLLLPLSTHPTGTWAAAMASALKAGEADAEPVAREFIGGAVQRIAHLAEHGLARLQGIDAARARTRATRLARVETARAYLEQRLDRRVNLGEVARAAGLSEFHLHRAFVDVWGEAPGAFHARARMERAEQMIRSGLTPAAVAKASGYSTHASFHRAFVRHYGCTPRQVCAPCSAQAAGSVSRSDVSAMVDSVR